MYQSINFLILSDIIEANETFSGGNFGREAN